jgi:hypothetical protein
VVSTDPLTLRFDTTDHQFAVPAAENCGPWTERLSRRLGLPAPAGTDSSTQTTVVRLPSY